MDLPGWSREIAVTKILKILDQKIIISRWEWSWSMYSSDPPKWSMVNLDQKFLKLINFTDINFQRSWSIIFINYLTNYLLSRWSVIEDISAMTREPIWWIKIQKRKNMRRDSTWRIGRSLIELKDQYRYSIERTVYARRSLIELKVRSPEDVSGDAGGWKISYRIESRNIRSIATHSVSFSLKISYRIESQRLHYKEYLH